MVERRRREGGVKKGEAKRVRGVNLEMMRLPVSREGMMYCLLSWGPRSRDMSRRKEVRVLDRSVRFWRARLWSL